MGSDTFCVTEPSAVPAESVIVPVRVPVATTSVPS
jgi:hypothetical protein